MEGGGGWRDVRFSLRGCGLGGGLSCGDVARFLAGRV